MSNRDQPAPVLPAKAPEAVKPAAPVLFRVSVRTKHKTQFGEHDMRHACAGYWFGDQASQVEVDEATLKTLRSNGHLLVTSLASGADPLPASTRVVSAQEEHLSLVDRHQKALVELDQAYAEIARLRAQISGEDDHDHDGAAGPMASRAFLGAHAHPRA